MEDGGLRCYDGGECSVGGGVMGWWWDGRGWDGKLEVELFDRCPGELWR